MDSCCMVNQTIIFLTYQYSLSEIVHYLTSEMWQKTTDREKKNFAPQSVFKSAA